MYLIAAEAVHKLNTNGDKGDAYNYLEILANARAIDGNGAVLLAKYGIFSSADINLEFILEERAREFVAEQLRWFDLKRLDRNEPGFDMVDWIKSKNPDTKLMKPYHKNRPIPQIQINAMKNPELYYEINAPYTSGGN